MPFGIIKDEMIVSTSIRKICTFPLRLALIITIYGALFLIMHWPYGRQLILIGTALIMIFYTIRFLYKNPKERLDYIKFGLISLWAFNYFNKVFHVLNLLLVFEIILIALFLWWLIEEGFSYVTNRELKNGKVLKVFYNTLIIITGMLIVFGLLFKIMHWPYGPILFTFGILSLSILLIVDFFAIQRSN